MKAPRAARPLPPLPLEQRLAEDLRMTGGQMPIAVIVADEAERTAATRFLAGRKGARMLTIVTAAESEAQREGWLRGAHRGG